MTRIEFLLKEFVKSEVLPEEVLFDLIEADPTTRIQRDEEGKGIAVKTKVGRYSQWIIREYLEINPKNEEGKRVFMEDLYKTKDDLIKYDRFKNRLPVEKRDINNLTLHYHDPEVPYLDENGNPKKILETLYDNVKDFDILEATTTKSERRSTWYHPGANLFYEDDKWLVMEIADIADIAKEAAVFYGGFNKETRWCTSAPGGSYYSTYVKDSPLYVFLDKSDTEFGSHTQLPKRRFQIHFHTNQFMDVDDRRFDFVKLLLDECHPDLRLKFKDQFYSALSKNTESVKIGKNDKNVLDIAKLYGLDDFFNNINPNIEELHIVNNVTKEEEQKSENKLREMFQLNESMYRLKNLTYLVIENMVDKINIDLSKFEKLSYISLRDNENLTDLGCDILNFKNLNQLIVTGCKIPTYTDFELVEVAPDYYDFELSAELEKEMGIKLDKFGRRI